MNVGVLIPLVLGCSMSAQAPPPKPINAAMVTLAPGELVTEQDLFTLAKYRDRDRLERWPTLTPEQKSRVLRYFSMGKKSGIDERGLKRLGLKLMSFYETVNEQTRIIQGDDSIKSVLSLAIIGGELEEMLPGHGFAKNGAAADKEIIEYLDRIGAEADKRGAEADKRGAEYRKQAEILQMLIDRLKNL